MSALPGQCPEPIRAPGFFFFLSLAARAEPRRPFRAPFAGSARSRYALRVSSFARVRPLAPKSGVLSGLRLRAVPGADTRTGFLLLPESGRSRLSPASFPGFVCGQCPEPIRAPAYSSYLRRSAYRLRRPKHRSAAPDRSIKSSHGRIRAVSPVGGVTPGSSDSPGVSSR